jgi:beta-lactamase class A
MTATENTATGFTLAYKNESIQAYVESLNEAYFIPAQSGTVSFVDGTEVSRTGGQAGSGIDSTAAVQAIIDGLAENSPTITLPLSTISARYTVDRNYSNSDSGLYSLISDLVAEYGDYAISIYEFGGSNRYADIKGDNVYIAASTYKLYIAMHALQQLEAGNLDLESPFAGITVGKCFDLMIHHSDNYCASTFINTFSRQTLTDVVHAEGFSNTKFTEDGIYTSANDLTNFLVKLASTELTNEANRDKLLELMKHQIYRNGIPTGAPDSTVANKVGYYGGYRHDTGIVYGPKSTYALSIVSYAGSYPEIVAMTKKIHAFMQQ